MKKKRLLPLGILAVLVLAALIYTRPMTLEAMFGLDITQSELVYTDYLTVSIDEPGRSVESSVWPRGEERTEKLNELLSQQKFRRSLINLLSPDGGSTHQPKDGDFIWDLSFNFGPTDFPDGSTGSGTFLQCRNFFGVLRIFNAVEDETLRCTVQDQEAFLQQVYDIISAEP